MKPKTKISFGIIVLNGEPFTRYCLRAVYPYAHEIIVVEGGSEAARAVMTADGHSVDGTLAALWKFKEEEDAENKLQIVTHQGFWPGKDRFGGSRTQQSQAYASRATGDYLWQIDIDEFYLPGDMESIIEMISENPTITAVSFETLTFWARPEYVADCWELRRGESEYHRLFKWGPGYNYAAHEPPTVVDDKGADMRDVNWIRGRLLAARGIRMYHYSLVFPWQVRQKTLVYQIERPDYCAEIVEWAENNYFQLRNPFRVHNLYRSPSWLERYAGVHPPEVTRMIDDIARGATPAETRQTEDVEKLLNSRWYSVAVVFLKAGNALDWQLIRLVQFMRRVKHRLVRHRSVALPD